MPPETGPRTDGTHSSVDPPGETGSADALHAERALSVDRGETYGETARKVLQKCDPSAPEEVPPREYAVGETFPFLGEPRTVALSPRHESGAVTEDAIVLARPRGAETVDVRSALRDLYRRAAGRYFGRRVVEYAREMDRDPPQVVLFDSPTRLVDCREEPPVRLNWRTVMLPPAVVDHAVVHALAHFERPGHTAYFEELVTEHRPDVDDDEWLDPLGIAVRLPP